MRAKREMGEVRNGRVKGPNGQVARGNELNGKQVRDGTHSKPLWHGESLHDHVRDVWQDTGRNGLALRLAPHNKVLGIVQVERGELAGVLREGSGE